MKSLKKTTQSLILSLFFVSSGALFAQQDSLPLISKLAVEVRADFNYQHDMTHFANGDLAHDADAYGFAGQYFNFILGGNLTNKLSYYLRQRVIANPGSVTFFDNTDYLYLDYAFNKNWSVRAGKEVLALGGFEYDAPPIDVLYSSFCWENIYCFQLAASASYHSNDGNHTLTAQVATSPYFHYGSYYKNSLLGYNVFWSGNFGHFKTLYSISMFERERGKFMNNIALGNKVVFKKWDWYVDLIHRATNTKQILKDFSIVSCANVYFNDYVNLFVKGCYEQNFDELEIDHFLKTGELWDCLSFPGQQSFYAGLGVEIHPKACKDVRIHAFLADFCSRQTANLIAAGVPVKDSPVKHSLKANVGLSWNINFIKFLKK